MFVLLFVSIIHLSPCVAVADVEYSFKYSYEGQSDHEHDYFGFSLATSNHKLVVGAPAYHDGRGSITVMPDGLQVRGPPGGVLFGESVDMNQEFMIVSGYPDMFVYKSSSPYNMVAKIPIGGLPPSLITTAAVISEDNTIAIMHVDDHKDYWLTIYQYDSSESWHIAEKFDLESRAGSRVNKPSLAVQGDILVVGVPYTSTSDDQGRVRIFNRVGGKWTQGQTLEQDGVQYFGWSVTIYGHHLAVSTFQGNVFTYKLDEFTNTWVGNGRFSVPSEYLTSLHLHKDMLAITVNNPGSHPDLCGVVYKLNKLSAATTTNYNNDINVNNTNVTTTITKNNMTKNVVWEEIARLTTKGDPKTKYLDQLHIGISIEEKVVFIGRLDIYGKVFVHDLTNINN